MEILNCLAFYVLPFYLLAIFEFPSVGWTKQDSCVGLGQIFSIKMQHFDTQVWKDRGFAHSYHSA